MTALPDPPPQIDTPDQNDTADRRAFLAKCGRFAVVTPPAVTMLLSTSLSSQAIAQSGGRGGPPGHNPGPGGTPPGHGGTPPGHGGENPGRHGGLLGWLLGLLS